MKLQDFIVKSSGWKKQEQIAIECMQVLDLVKSNPHTTYKEVSEKLHLSPAAAQNRLGKLSKMGLIRHIEQWVVVSESP